MLRSSNLLAPLMALSLVLGYSESRNTTATKPLLWTDPTDIQERNLFYGIGGAERAPTAAPFTFVKEDLDGNSPKFLVKDSQGTEWKVKLGREARPETVVTRFVWAAGYHVDQDYFVASQEVRNMPAKLKRGFEFVSGDGFVRDARWERVEEKKTGEWKWKNNPHSKTRELNGLRVLMALFNNYDMKDSQNSVYATSDGGSQMAVADLGATLGPTGSRWPVTTGRGELDSYTKSKFITSVNATKVNFATPTWPFMFGFLPLFPLPYTTITYPVKAVGLSPVTNPLNQLWIGRGIPREDARWMGQLLGRLSPAQIRDAFKAAGYPPEEVEGFSVIVEQRIAALSQL